MTFTKLLFAGENIKQRSAFQTYVSGMFSSIVGMMGWPCTAGHERCYSPEEVRQLLSSMRPDPVWQRHCAALSTGGIAFILMQMTDSLPVEDVQWPTA